MKTTYANEYEVELDSEGVIRYFDNDGNCADIFRPEDEDYARHLALFEEGEE